MPCLDIYQNAQLKDKDTVNCFLLAHRCRHDIYAQAMALAGVGGVQPVPDTGPDDAWFLTHATVHQTIYNAGFMAPNQSVDMTVLTNYSWDNQDDFSTWMFMHTQIHQSIDQYFGVFT